MVVQRNIAFDLEGVRKTSLFLKEALSISQEPSHTDTQTCIYSRVSACLVFLQGALEEAARRYAQTTLPIFSTCNVMETSHASYEKAAYKIIKKKTGLGEKEVLKFILRNISILQKFMPSLVQMNSLKKAEISKDPDFEKVIMFLDMIRPAA